MLPSVIREQSRQNTQGNVSYWRQRQAIDYIIGLYKAGEISQQTYEYLIREACARWVEQMVEEKIENQLKRLTNRFDQKALEMAVLDLFQKTPSLL